MLVRGPVGECSCSGMCCNVHRGRLDCVRGAKGALGSQGVCGRSRRWVAEVRLRTVLQRVCSCTCLLAAHGTTRKGCSDCCLPYTRRAKRMPAYLPALCGIGYNNPGGVATRSLLVPATPTAPCCVRGGFP